MEQKWNNGTEIVPERKIWQEEDVNVNTGTTGHPCVKK